MVVRHETTLLLRADAPSAMKSFPLRLVLLFIASTATAVLQGQTAWVVRNPKPIDAPLNRLTFGQGKFVGVGAAGGTITSSHGATWTERTHLQPGGYLIQVSSIDRTSGVTLAGIYEAP